MAGISVAPPLPPVLLPAGIEDLTERVTIDYQRDHLGASTLSDVHYGYLNGGEATNVAVKLIRIYPHQQREKYQRRFAREATIWSTLNHQNVHPLLGIINWNNYTQRPGLVSSLAQRIGLLAYVENMDMMNKHLILLGFAKGLEYLHNNNVVHGDVKPVSLESIFYDCDMANNSQGNILISNEGIPKICDFGLSRCVDIDSHHTFTRYRMTHAHTAPEILDILFRNDAENEEIDTLAINTKESDVYAFSITAAEILMGRGYRIGNALSDAWTQRVLSGYRPEVNSLAHLEILGNCWCHDPADRLKMRDVVRLLSALTI
ncbi:hypothetical protein AMATHDRAFT_8667 [Amanita thiersii Skay4041]|uniref:Protein kinase domain-containing protein n=1 Tax=Amanita thiersii Skay4041 TaxID=703135 RepID=A0A2A9N757_9AGAR|nr:hypothetical protein AMATHDRAFT_8667 [Amanita thiersii Skay4041]